MILLESVIHFFSMGINTKYKIHDIKLYALFTFIALFLGFALYFFQGRKNTLIEEERFSLLCKEKANEIDTFFIKSMNTLNTISVCTLSGIEDEKNLYDTEKRKSYIEKTEKIFASYLLRYVASSITFTKGITSAYLQFDSRYGTENTGIFLSISNNDIVHKTLTDLSQFNEKDIENAGYYYLPAKAKKAQWLEPYKSKYTNKNIISYVVPLILDKQVLGVMGIDMDIEFLSEQISNIRILKKGFAYLQTKSGQSIYSNRRKAKDNITKAIKLKNDMTLVFSIPKNAVYPFRYNKLHHVIIVFYALYTMFLAVLLYTKLREYAKVKSDTAIIKRQRVRNFATAIIVIICALTLQAITLSKEMHKTKKRPQIAINAKNTFDKTLHITGDINFAPYSYQQNDGTYTGHNIELINEIANRLGFNVDITLEEWSSAQNRVASGKSDLLLGYEVLSGKKNEKLLRTEAAVEDSFVILGKEKISGIIDLKNKKVASISGAEIYDLYNLTPSAIIYNNTVNEIISVAKGENDYAIVRENVANMVLAENEIHELFKVYDMIESHLGFAVNDREQYLQNKLNLVLRELKEDGTLLSLRKKWLEYDVQKKSILSVLQKNLAFYLVTGSIIFFSFCSIIIAHFKYKAESATIKGEQFRILSETDSLTGIRNRGSGEAEIKRLIKLKKYGMFCIFDADKFKSINDTFGHETGDTVIKEIAKSMKRALREQDVFMRLGGDEFAFFSPNIKREEDGIIVIKRLFDCISAIKIEEMKDKEISVSLGAAFFFYIYREETDFDELYKKADRALYKSKNMGGKSFNFYTDYPQKNLIN